MQLFRSIGFSAVVAGVAAGAVITVIQQLGTVPLILKPETYERGQRAKSAEPPSAPVTVGHSHAESAVAEHEHEHEHGAAAWKPEDGLQRNAFTAGANVLTAVGFALVLAALFAFRTGHGAHGIHWHRSEERRVGKECRSRWSPY